MEELNDSKKDEEGRPLSTQSLDMLAALAAKPGCAGNQPCFGAQATTAACSVVQ